MIFAVLQTRCNGSHAVVTGRKDLITGWFVRLAVTITAMRSARP
jgi:hypothetical protein